MLVLVVFMLIYGSLGGRLRLFCNNMLSLGFINFYGNFVLEDLRYEINLVKDIIID